jgi:hypothetical protein
MLLKMKKLIWVLFHWPKYSVGEEFMHNQGNHCIILRKRFICPLLWGKCSWGYSYEDGFAIGEEGLKLLYTKRSK